MGGNQKVWVAESGEYEQRYVSFVSASPEAALRHARKKWPEYQWTAEMQTWGDEQKRTTFHLRGIGADSTMYEIELNPSEFAS